MVTVLELGKKYLSTGVRLNLEITQSLGKQKPMPTWGGQWAKEGLLMAEATDGRGSYALQDCHPSAGR